MRRYLPQSTRPDGGVPRGGRNGRLVVAISAAAALMLSAAACGGSDNEGSGGDSDSWRVGTPLAFTGAAAAYAPSQENGIALAVEQLNNDAPPAGKEIEILSEDTESKEDVAISTFEDLVRGEQVDAVIGPTTSAEAFAADPIADEEGIPVIGPANTAAGIADIGDCVFRVSAEETLIVPGSVQAATSKLDIGSVAVIYASSDEFNETAGKTFVSAFEDEGVEVTGTATFATGDTNFQAQLTELLGPNPDALAIAAYTPEGILVVRQARELGFDGPVIGNKGFSGATVVDEVGDKAGTVVVGAQWHQDLPTAGNKEFVAAYEDKFGDPPDEFAALAYDAVHLLAAGMEDAGPDAEPPALCEALQGVGELSGVTGELKFEGGDVSTSGIAVISEDGSPFRLIK